MQAIVLSAILFTVASIYIRLADRLNIVDKPNQRSSHTQATVRGGGIIFPLAWLLFSLYNGFAFPWFTTGLILISAVSFWDDTGHVPAWLRFVVHVLAFSFCFWELGLIGIFPWWGILMLYVVCIGIVNAINFMDGINGITGLYSLAVLIPLFGYWPDAGGTSYFSVNNPLFFIILALLVFGIFNFRKKARCFAGDVGSVSIGFILLFFLLMLFAGIWIPGQQKLYALESDYKPDLKLKYLLFLAVYGVDSVLTIIHRLFLKESIFQPHRKHLYQYLSNEMKWPHLSVALLYATLQLIICGYVLHFKVGFTGALVLCLALGLLYIVSKRYIIKRQNALVKD
jgi:UDP-N-acetylmuramyl pentapeptide phosphotransferase/UDP-N-acetylglucosamine-1-phosphate transferase